MSDLLVSCIMPTYNRRHLVKQAIELFESQDYEHRELVVIDDGASVEDLLPRGDLRYRYVRTARMAVGGKRNVACEASKGALIAHWDDDDWYSPRRLSAQVALLEQSKRSICGLPTPLYVNEAGTEAWKFTGAHLARPWMTLLMYRREAWARARFANVQRGADTLFLEQFRPEEIATIRDETLNVCRLHKGNVSPKYPHLSRQWEPAKIERVRTIVGPGWITPASAPAPLPSRDRWVVVVFTCERPELLGALLGDLERERAAGVELDVRVYDDASEADYGDLRARIEAAGWRYTRALKRHGRRAFAAWVSHAYGELRNIDARTLLAFLPDDVRLCEQFFTRAAVAWRSIGDDRARALTVLVDESRESVPCWTQVPPVRVGATWRTQWVDGAFVADRRFLESVGYAVPPLTPRRQVDADASSGVGRAISEKLHGAGMTLYRTHESLLAHVDARSQMHPDLRRRQPLRTVRFVDGDAALRRLTKRDPVVASLASIPSRREQLARTVASLLPQVDRVRVYLNGYDSVPEFLSDPRVDVAHGSDVGDAGKFHWCEEPGDAYLLTCDDDIVYPVDYASKMVLAIEHYHRRAVVGLHGVTLLPKVTSYYKSRRVLHCNAALERDTPVHLVGTGCAAWHTSTVQPTRAAFEAPNMADVWFGLVCQRAGVPVVAVAHPAGWLTLLEVPSSIFDTFKGKDRKQTAAVRSLDPWRIYPAEGA